MSSDFELTLILAGILVFTSIVPGSVAYAETGPTHISLPYLSNAQASLPKTWQATSCDLTTELDPELLAFSCKDNQLSVSSQKYDPKIKSATISVELIRDTFTTHLLYEVHFEPPAKPQASPVNYNYPFAQGVRAIIPLSDLGTQCEGCQQTGGTYTVGSVEPSSAGKLDFSDTHLVFSPAPDFQGKVLLSYSVTDAYGTESDPLELTLAYKKTNKKQPILTSQLITVDDRGFTEGQALDGAIDPEKKALTLLGCGDAFHGKVTCGGDGSFTYVAPAGFIGIDQFAIHVYSDSGEQAVGTVQVGVRRDAPPADTTKLAPEATSAFLSPNPRSNTEIAANGIFSGLVQVMNRNAPR